MISKKNHDRLVFWIFLAPALLAFILVVIVPFFMGLYFSFTDWSAIVGLKTHWTGLENYRNLLSDTKFQYSFLRTFTYTFVNMVSVNLTAFLLALLVTQNLRLKNLYRAGFFLPNLIGGLVLGYIWQFIYNSVIPSFGELIANSALSNTLILANPQQMFTGLVLTGTWQYAGYIMVIYIAALQNVPQELIEASMIDGAGPLRRLRSILFPMVAQAFTITSFLTLVTSFKQFDLIIALSNGGPPTMYKDELVNSTEMLAVHLYSTAFKYNKLAEGQAQAIIFFLILTCIALIQVWINKKREVEM